MLLLLMMMLSLDTDPLLAALVVFTLLFGLPLVSRSTAALAPRPSPRFPNKNP